MSAFFSAHNGDGQMGIKFVDNSGKVIGASREASERALEAIGLVAEGYAKFACPKITGRLQNSISHATEGDKEFIGTNVEYAPYVEFGTSKRSARPYLIPAATDHGEEYKQILKSELQKG